MFRIPFVLLKMAVIFLITNLTFGNTFVGQMTEERVRTIATITSHFITEIVAVWIPVADMNWTVGFKIVLASAINFVCSVDTVGFHVAAQAI